MHLSARPRQVHITGSFIFVCSTDRVSDTSLHLVGRRARIDVSLDGVTFTRSESDAAKRGAARRTHVDWQDVTGAVLEVSGKGRPVIRVRVAGVSAVGHHRADPYAIKVARRQAEAARDLVDHIEDEVAARRRWRLHAGR